MLITTENISEFNQIVTEKVYEMVVEYFVFLLFVKIS